MDPERISLLVQTDGEWTILRRVDQGMLPLALVELLSIGPRKSERLDVSDVLPATLFQDVFERADDSDNPPQEDLARNIRPMWPDAYASLVDGEWRFWTLEAYACAETPMQSRGSMAVLDTSSGMLRVSPEGDEDSEADDEVETVKATSMMPSDIWIDILTLIAPST